MEDLRGTQCGLLTRLNDTYVQTQTLKIPQSNSRQGDLLYVVLVKYMLSVRTVGPFFGKKNERCVVFAVVPENCCVRVFRLVFLCNIVVALIN